MGPAAILLSASLRRTLVLQHTGQQLPESGEKGSFDFADLA